MKNSINFILIYFLTASVYAQFPSKTFNVTGTGKLPGSSMNITDNGLPGVVDYSDGFYKWIVPSSGKYLIEIAGAKGGGAGGGEGAVIKGEVVLTVNDTVLIAVGQRGTLAKGRYQGNGGGGGGGTFLVINDNPLLIAGGGGGGNGDYGGSYPNVNNNKGKGVTTTNGSSTGLGYGGINGNGATYGAGDGEASPGAGFYSDGNYSTNSSVGKSYANGLIGGDSDETRTYYGGDGGFGGGGAGYSNILVRGGGGGGYSGGQGGAYNARSETIYTLPKTNSDVAYGGGGGSFIRSDFYNVSTSDGNYDSSNSFNGNSITNLNNTNSGDGYAIITSLFAGGEISFDLNNKKTHDYCITDLPIDLGVTVSNSTAIGGDGNYTYSWEISEDVDFSNSTSINNNSLTIDLPTVNAETYVRRKVTDGNGDVAYSNVINFNQLESPTITNNLDTNSQTICIGGNSSPLTILAEGDNLSYQWYTNSVQDISGGTIITGATSSTYTPLTNVLGTKYYYVIISGTCLPNVTSEISGPITTSSSISDGDMSVDQIICSGTAPNDISISNYNGDLQWQKSEDQISWSNINGANTSILSSILIGNISTKTYFRTLISGNGCTTITSNVVTIDVLPTATITNNLPTTSQNINIGESAAPLSFTTSTNSVSIQWKKTASTNSLVTEIVNDGTWYFSGSGFQDCAGYSGSKPCISDGVVTFAYIDNSYVYKDVVLNSSATEVSFSAEYLETDRDGSKAPDTGKIQLQFLNSSNGVISTSSSSDLTSSLTWQTASLNNITIPSGAVKVRVILYQINEAEYWAGNYGIKFRNPTLSDNSIPSDAVVISGATSTTYTPSTSEGGTTYYFAEVTDLCGNIINTGISGAIVVNKLSNSISGLSNQNMTTTDDPLVLSGVHSSTAQITYSSSNTSVATISGTALVPNGVGTAVITASVSETAIHLSASTTFNVTVILGDSDGDGIIDTNDNCPTTANADQLDTDNDGIGDVCDSDIDGDGIPNASDVDPDGDGTNDNGTDTDGDGTNDANDPDIDGDGIPNASDVDPDGDGTNDNGTDTDGDGTNDANDPDIDGDGIPNASDVDPDGDGINDNGTDTDGDGTNDANDPDIDGDGVPNGSDSNPTNPDQDGDGILDGADVDIDGDGINDNGTDTDGDGINNANDTDDDGDGVLDVNDAFPLDPNESLDTDVDGVGNNADTDDDNDGVLDDNDDLPLDSTESVDTDGDGIGNNADTDDDGDGVLDVNDAYPLDESESVDSDGDGIGNNADTDDDNDGVLDVNDAFPLDSTESADTDGDGIGNNTDSDDDGDGVLDVNDAFPLDGTETIDTDGDGTGDNSDPDIDGDGIPNASDVDPNGDGTNDNGSDFDGDGYNDAGDTDDDNDGVLDVNDAFPLDATESADTDGDGVGNNTDTDDDGDGLSDAEEAELNTNPLLVDTDNDGVIDATEVTDKTNPLNPCSLIVEHQTESVGMTYWDSLDCDNDGVPNGQEVSSTPANSGSRTSILYAFDTDGDGILNYMDADDDGDGVNTIDELLLNSSTGEYSVIDSDQDSIPNYLDSDDDNDGIDTIVETSVDTDGDGTPDYLDSDDDGDGVITALELSFSNTQNPTEFDSDGDGIPNHLDAEDNYEPTIATISVDPNTFVYLDTDGDGIPNMTDSDDDNDGFTDAVEVSCNANPLRIESQPGDYDDDGIADCIDADIDGDGVDNESDLFPLNPFESADNDNDGIGDNVDADDDNDGVIDALDAFPLDPNESADTDGDGIGNNVDNDLYNDGFDDSRLEVSGVLTPNTNGVESTWKITNINLHPLNKVAVYNTNGVEVFATENYDNSWDGTYKGTTRRVPAGSYLYKVYLYDTRETLTGWLYIAY